MTSILNMEKRIPNNQNLWNIIFNIFGFFPLVFIISLFTFYINAGLVNGFSSISSIRPDNLNFYNFYEGIILYSYIFSFFSSFAWVITVLIYRAKNHEVIVSKPVIFTSVLYIIFIIIASSKIMEFAIE